MTQSQNTTVSEMMLDVLESIDRNIDSLTKQKPVNKNREIFQSMSMGGMAKRALPAIGAAGFMAYAKSVIDTEAGMARLSKILNVAATELLSLERAGRRFNTSFTQGLMNIKSQFAGLEQEDVSALYESLARYGVQDPTKFMEAIDKDDTMQLFRELQKVWTELNNNQKLRISETLGIDRGMMDILNDPEKFSRFVSETNVTEEDIKAAEKAKEAMDNLTLKLDQFMTKVVNGLIPSIDKLVGWLNQMDPDELATALNVATDSIFSLISALDRIFGTGEEDTGGRQDKIIETSQTLVNKKNELERLNKLALEIPQKDTSQYMAISQIRWRLKDEIKQLERTLKEEQEAKFKEFQSASLPEKISMLANDVIDMFSGNQNKVTQINESESTVNTSTSSEDNRSRNMTVQFNNDFQISTNDPEQVKQVILKVQEEQFKEATKQEDWP